MIYNSKTEAGHIKELDGAEYELIKYGPYDVMVFTFYVTPLDSMGQRIGTVEEKKCTVCGLTFKNGFIYDNRTFLFKSYAAACRAAED